MLRATQSPHVLDRQVRLTLQTAMVVFVYTIVVGILNGLNLVEFSRPLLLAHLHGGTLGWMTLGILAATLWLFGVGETPSGSSQQMARGLAYLACGAITLYVLAFATTTSALRPLAGVATLTALTGSAAWAYSRARYVVLSVPRLFVLVGLTTSVLGGLFGVVNGLAIAFDWDVPNSFFEAHPGTMEIGFVIPVAMGLAEWALRPERSEERATRAGKFQVGFMFLAFLVILTAILAEQDALVGAGSMVAMIAIIIFFVRMWPTARRTSLMRRSPSRHALVGGVLVGAAIVYISVVINVAGGDFAAIPRGRQLGFLHLMSVGGTTNALLGFIVGLSRRTTEPSAADDAIFWGLTIGVLGFVTALTLDIEGLIVLFAPIMGLSLLLAIAVHFTALGKGPPPSPIAAPATPGA